MAEVLDAAIGRGPVHVQAHLDRCASCRRLAALADVPEPAARSTDLTAGRVLCDRFRIEQWVASGGMGAIYRATDLTNGAQVAIKIATHGDRSAMARFEREARLLAQVQHPALVEHVAHYLDADPPFLAMAWLDGVDLATRLAVRTGSSEAEVRTPLPIDDVMALGRRLADALVALHERAIIHRDIKPGNIFVVRGTIGASKLIDLGTAREEIELHPLTELGTVVGTAYYMAPEQVRSAAVTAAIDLWAVGCVLYECLTGRVAFGASQPLAAMTRILIDDPEPVASLRPDCPAHLADIVRELLSKDPAARPTASRLQSLLAGPGRHPALATRPHRRSEGPSHERVIRGERFLRTFVFARSPSGAELPELDLVTQHGGQVSRLAPGTGAALITFDGSQPGKDDAVRAAQLGLALRAVRPDLVLVLASGADADGAATPVPAMVDRAISTLLSGSAGEVRLDRTTARLIADRFVIDEDADVYRLVNERPVDATPGVTGDAGPLVGRQRELTMLVATLDECIENDVARAVLVTAPAGQGKSRLRHELVLELGRLGRDVLVLLGRGEPLSAGTPFLMLAPALRRIASIDGTESLPEMRTKLCAAVDRVVDGRSAGETAAFLGEIAGVAFPDAELQALRAARREPSLLAQRTRDALCAFLRGLARTRPLLVVLDDLHWGDLPSVLHVDALLRELEGVPLMVLALARPEVETVFPSLWRGRDVELLRLRPLAHKPAVELARHVLGSGPTAAEIDLLVDRSEGNPFFLEELLHATRAGLRELPETVLAIVQSRLRSLPEQHRQALLVASVFGEVFCVDAVAALLDKARGAADPARELLALELIGPELQTPVAGYVAYRFRHSLLREAAYAMWRDDDVVRAHARAAGWLIARGASDPLVLAGHFMAAGQPERAIRYFLQAAEAALAASDMVAVVERAERAQAAGASGRSLGRVRELQTASYYWLGRYADAVRTSREAVELLEEGTDEWYRPLGLGIAAAARLNEFGVGEAMFARAARAPGHGTERTICLTRAAYQQVWEARLVEADRTIALIGQVRDADALSRAQLADLLGLRHYVTGDLGPSFPLIREARDLFQVAGDANNALLARVVIAWGHVRCGAHDGNEAVLRALVQEASGRGIIEVIARMALAYELLDNGSGLDEAEEHFRVSRAYYESVGSVRYQGWATIFLASCALERGLLDPALTLAKEGVATLQSHRLLLGHALGVEAQVLIAQGKHDAAWGPAMRALELADELRGQFTCEMLPSLIAAELHAHAGQGEAARDVIVRARERVAWYTSRYTAEDDHVRRAYLLRPEIVRLAELAAAHDV
jgi:eukaryotic-like serine/threonine-protein kinase